MVCCVLHELLHLAPKQFATQYNEKVLSTIMNDSKSFVLYFSRRYMLPLKNDIIQKYFWLSLNISMYPCFNVDDQILS